MNSQHAKTLAGMLSNEASDILRKMWLGQSYMGRAEIWEELQELSMVDWSNNLGSFVLTRRGRMVAAKL